MRTATLTLTLLPRTAYGVVSESWNWEDCFSHWAKRGWRDHCDSCSTFSRPAHRYIDSIPKTLGQLYESLGIVIPQKLAGVLPTDFFSDDSVTQESKSPLSSVPLMGSGGRSVPGGTDSDQLEELRTRSAKKRR